MVKHIDKLFKIWLNKTPSDNELIFTNNKTRNNTYAFSKSQNLEAFINTIEIKKTLNNNDDVELDESISRSISNLSIKTELLGNVADMLENNNVDLQRSLKLATETSIQREK